MTLIQTRTDYLLQIYLVGAFFVYCLFLISLLDSKPSPTAAHLATWIAALALEIAVVALSFKIYTHAHKDATDGRPSTKLRFHMTDWEGAEVAIDLLRILLLLSLIGFYAIFVILPQRRTPEENRSSSETTSLLDSGAQQNGHANGSYGATHPVAGKNQPTEGAPPAWSRPTGVPSRSWWEYIKGYSVFFPYLWLSKDTNLQIVVVLCFLLVMAQRVINLLVPDQLGRIVARLTGLENGSPWTAIIFHHHPLSPGEQRSARCR